MACLVPARFGGRGGFGLSLGGRGYERDRRVPGGLFTDAVDVKFVDDGPNHDTAPPELTAHVAHALVIVPLA